MLGDGATLSFLHFPPTVPFAGGHLIPRILQIAIAYAISNSNRRPMSCRRMTLDFIMSGVKLPRHAVGDLNDFASPCLTIEYCSVSVSCVGRLEREDGAIPSRSRRCNRGRTPPMPFSTVCDSRMHEEKARPVERSESQKTCRHRRKSHRLGHTGEVSTGRDDSSRPAVY